jgi:hypothetical protein
VEDLAEILCELSSWFLTKLIYAFKRRGKQPDVDGQDQPPTLRASIVQPPSLSPGARIVLTIIILTFFVAFFGFLWSVRH